MVLRDEKGKANGASTIGKRGAERKNWHEDASEILPGGRAGSTAGRPEQSVGLT